MRPELSEEQAAGIPGTGAHNITVPSSGLKSAATVVLDMPRPLSSCATNQGPMLGAKDPRRYYCLFASRLNVLLRMPGKLFGNSSVTRYTGFF